MFGTKEKNGFDSLISRPPPSKLQKLSKEPCLYLARVLYNNRRRPHPVLPSNPITVVCISDTHNAHLDLEIPNGEILIHAGDATYSGTLGELQATINWMDKLPHRHKVMIGGNHDIVLYRDRTGPHSKERSDIDWRSVTYLENEAVTLLCSGGRQVQVYGSPQTPRHGNWVFQYERSQDVWENTVPDGTDILVTHGPPRSHLDEGYGCDFLLKELWRARPRLHVFGHIHAGYGQEWIAFDSQQKAFEGISKARGGVWRLPWLCATTLVAKIIPRRTASTLLVNAASVGGLRDDQRRSPVVVTI